MDGQTTTSATGGSNQPTLAALNLYCRRHGSASKQGTHFESWLVLVAALAFLSGERSQHLGAVDDAVY
jgi:hypothetical protein